MTHKIKIILDAPSSLLINETEIVVPKEKAWLVYVEAILAALNMTKEKSE